MKRLFKRLSGLAVILGLLGLVAWTLRPKPLVVETGRVARGHMLVTIDEDGQTRAHDRFTLAAPIAGRLSRIRLHEGDAVSPQTVIATISPLPIDAREVARTKAEIESLEALRKEALQYVERAEADHEQTQRDVVRYTDLQRQDMVSRQTLEQAQTAEKRAAKEVAGARFKVQSAEAEIARARAGLISIEESQEKSSRIVELRSPVASRILRILEPSEHVVTAGTPVVTLSNPSKIEIVIDLLSTDAVKVKPGAAVSIEGWGGPKALRARVRLVEPYGFTKVSALGIEEQRVNVIADFLDPPVGLGDGYRVDARIVIWENPDVMIAPASALFRDGDRWSVFVIEGGRAHRRPVEVGHRNALEAEIIRGLSPGEAVILHPANDLKDGVPVTSR
ncbi:MAG: efflux RND transporter periplasmic adaptor subunit [Acidobacteriia bacterium]|nr:efflux RND transporter periplasmic adaptor subunit [Terriglobia bacterium]